MEHAIRYPAPVLEMVCCSFIKYNCRLANKSDLYAAVFHACMPQSIITNETINVSLKIKYFNDEIQWKS